MQLKPLAIVLTLAVSAQFHLENAKQKLNRFKNVPVSDILSVLDNEFGEKSKPEPQPVPQQPVPNPAPPTPEPPKPNPEPPRPSQPDPPRQQAPAPVQRPPQEVQQPEPVAPQPIQISQQNNGGQESIPSTPQVSPETPAIVPVVTDTPAEPAATVSESVPEMPSPDADTKVVQEVNATESSNNTVGTIWTIVAVGGVLGIVVAGFVAHRQRQKSNVSKASKFDLESQNVASLILTKATASRASSLPRHYDRQASPLRNEIVVSSTMPRDAKYATISLQTVVQNTVASTQLEPKDREVLFGRESQIDKIQNLLPSKSHPIIMEESPVLDEIEPIYIGNDFNSDFIENSLNEIDDAIEQLGAPSTEKPVVKELVNQWEAKYECPDSPEEALKMVIDENL